MGQNTDPIDEQLKALCRVTIKPGMSKFPELTQETDYATWKRAFIPEANLQGFEDLLDENYVPSGSKETQLFEEQQKHFYSILSRVMKTSNAEDIIADNAIDTNGQKVWAEHDAPMTTSIVAKACANRFYHEIMTSSIKPHLPLQDQLVKFKNLFRSYDSYSATPMSDEDKATHMERFCAPAPGVNGVTSLTAMLNGIIGGTVTAKQKLDLTEQQALLSDNLPSVPTTGTTRRVHQAIIGDLSDSEVTYECDDGDGFTTIMKSEQGRFKRTHRIPATVWSQLTQDIRDKWLSFPADSRALILRAFANASDDDGSRSRLPSQAPLSSALRQHGVPTGQRRSAPANQRTRVWVAEQIDTPTAHDGDVTNAHGGDDSGAGSGDPHLVISANVAESVWYVLHQCPSDNECRRSGRSLPDGGSSP